MEVVFPFLPRRNYALHSPTLTSIAWNTKHILKESFGPRKENNSPKGPLLNHLTSEKTKQNFSSPWCSRPVASIWDLSPPVWKPTTPYPRPEDLSPPAQLQMSSQQKNTQNIPPDWRFPYRFHKPPCKYEASLIPLGAQPGRYADCRPSLPE